ncbi:MAG: alpha-amylase [Armatimonadetes bacterium]|nr:alpha-amylase [Anaerolineae bacterium]
MQNSWSPKPVIYELNTRVWLTELSRRYGYHINLYNVPDPVLDDLASYGFESVWLMGIWTRGAATWRSALNYTHEYRYALPDLVADDVAGSAYAVHEYQVEPIIGGRDGLNLLRARLRARGIKLMLDFIPNHVATDHAWLQTNPDYFVHRNQKALRRHPGLFFSTHDRKGRTYAAAHGRDPYFPSWIDTAQLNAFDPSLRRAMIDTLIDIAGQCDAVRCDMAMLMTNGVFNQTWGGFIDDPTPATEYWEEIIPAVRAAYPDFLFVAEVYWGMEYTLLTQGFDYTYDKTLYDRLLSEEVGKIRVHLEAPTAFQQRQLRFIENHDEPRAAAAFGIEKSKMAAAVVATLPGGLLLHDGQFEGRRVKLPVHLARQPDETINEQLEAFYAELLSEAAAPIYRQGTWTLLATEYWTLLAYGWQSERDYRLILVNVTGVSVQDTVKLPGWQPSGALHTAFGVHSTHTLMDSALRVTLAPYETLILQAERLSSAPVVTLLDTAR